MAIVNTIDTTLRGIGQFTFYDISNNRPLNLQKPAQFAIQHNPIQKRIPTTTDAGYQAFGSNFIIGYDYQLQLSQVVMQPEILQFKFGTIFEAVTNKNMYWTRSIDVYATTIPGASASGVIGFSLAEDDAIEVSATRANASFALTQVAFTGFDDQVDDQFAVGAAGELKFSANLLDQRVTLRIPYTVAAGYALSAKPVGRYRIEASIITTSNEVALLNIPLASPNFDGAGFSPNAETVDLPFYIQAPAGRDLVYDVVYTNETIS